MSKFLADKRVPLQVDAMIAPTPRDSRSIEAWDRVSRRLRAELGEEVFSSWFGRLELDGIVGATAHLSVPTKFLKSLDSVALHRPNARDPFERTARSDLARRRGPLVLATDQQPSAGL